MDYLANIATLGTTIFNILCKVFGLRYSQNFDNYKIVENILSKETKKPKELKNKNESNFNLEINLNNKDLEEKDNNL